MTPRPIIVLADDLTGASEIAAVAHQAGLRAQIVTRPPQHVVDTDVIVCDTNTRLASRAQAAHRVRLYISYLQKIPHAGFFKKVDSVLRGKVLAELDACADELGLKRILLLPANPSLGRSIRDGHYYIKGEPLHLTPFARDPHHPCYTSDVLTHLGPSGKTKIACRSIIPRRIPPGLTVGEASTPTDIARWANTVDHLTLPAGGADFFRAWLSSRIQVHTKPNRYGRPTGRALLLHGTSNPSHMTHALSFCGLRAPSADQVKRALLRFGAVAVAATPTTLMDPKGPAIISHEFGGLAHSLHQQEAFQHLLIAGGSTAGLVLKTLGWTRLHVVRVWSAGVVTLQPINAPHFVVTLKPGSYDWPANLRRSLPPTLFT